MILLTRKLVVYERSEVMFNIIICDDEKYTLTKITKMVDNYMNKNHIEYQKHIFEDYNNKFMNIITRPLPFKIYILDIETPSRSGIDVAREIRMKDLDSVIIFLTGHEELIGAVAKGELMALTFINKFDNCEERLCKALQKSFDVLHKKQVIKLSYGSINYIVKLNDILYFSTDTVDRKTIVKTDYDEFEVSDTLKSICKRLDHRFKQTHKSCIFNMSRVTNIDTKKRIVCFDTKDSTDLLSNKYMKELEL